MTISNIRQLTSKDRVGLEALLNAHPEQTVFLRYNLYRGGMNYSGKPGQSIFIGSFKNDSLHAVISITWNGHIQLYTPTDIAPLCASLLCFLRRHKRIVHGINGSTPFVREALKHLEVGKAEYSKQLDSDETLFALNLCDMKLPQNLEQNNLHIRQAKEEDYETLVDWQVDYSVEALGAKKSGELITHTQKRVKNLIAHAGKQTRILLSDNIPVSRTNFSANLPDIVMIAGVWTQPEYRNRGYARAAVAAHLLEAKSNGVHKAVLFTNSEAAKKAYRAIGFKEKGSYSMILYKEPWSYTD